VPPSANGGVGAFMTTMGEQAAAVTGSREGVRIALVFDEFFETERERLFRALLLVTHNSAEAEDLMQEAFVRVWERWDRVAQVEDPVGYLFRTAMNLHRSALRRALTAAKRSLRPPAGRDPFDEVAARDEAVRSLAMLTPRQRAAVVVTELLGYSSREASAILGVRPGTVRTLTSQARAALLESKASDDA
jgi:RNA polymerase sigma-70 factor, ECF subfamily